MLGAVFTTSVPTFSYLSGSDGGAVTVPAGEYVTQLWAGPGTFSILAANPYLLPPCSELEAGADAGDGGDAGDAGAPVAPCQDAGGPPIVVPAGTFYSMTVPTLFPGVRGLADGTIVTFGAGQSYVLALSTYSNP
jgi:hypothetical protein